MHDAAVFRIKFQCKRHIREFVAQDETRSAGYEKDLSTHEAVYIAPSEAVAMAHFKECNKFMIESKERCFSFLGVEIIRVDSCLINCTQLFR